jgi:RHS repeat-associated protein
MVVYAVDSINIRTRGPCHQIFSSLTTKYYEIKTLPQAGGTALQDVRHSWDAGGNLSTRLDVLSSETETFNYDFIDRLTGVSGPYTELFTYDETGNMTSMDGDTYTYGEDGAGPHAVTSIGDNIYTYDANGNMTACQEAGGSTSSGPTATVTITATPVQAPVATATVHITATPVQATTTTYTWDVENRLISTSGGASFVYDGDGNRVKSRFIKIIRDFESRDSQKTESSQTILYVNKYYEKNLTTGVVTTNYYLGDRLIATRVGTTLTYVHQDALTGTSVTTNSSGTSTGSIKYFSFGDCRNSSGSLPEQKFTGQRLDGTGLYYYGARYYDPTIGRFISADTIIPSPMNPQSLNRYSYCLNNPLKYTDPTGHDQIITSTGTSVNGQEGYFICDGAGNLLGVAYGLDDLAAKSSALESQSRGVNLPVVKQPDVRTDFQTTIKEIHPQGLLQLPVTNYEISGSASYTQTNSGSQVNLSISAIYHPFSIDWSHNIGFYNPTLNWTDHTGREQTERMTPIVLGPQIVRVDSSNYGWITNSGNIPNPYSCQKMYISLSADVSYDYRENTMKNYLSRNTITINLK